MRLTPKLVKSDVQTAMKASMMTFEQEQVPPDSQFMKHILEQSKNEYQLKQEKILRDIKQSSRQQFANPGNLPPIQQVANMGFPMELVLKAYQDVGDDVPTMIEYIYKSLG